MLSNEHRLRNQASFDRVYKRGKLARTPLFIMRAARAEKNVPRFAVVVSSKVSKKAVERNRVRRRMQAVLRDLIKQGVKPADVVINMGSQAVRAEIAEMERLVRKALVELKLL